ncbi:MAG: hypothetical protein KJZ83_00705 [Burkholderiaceae bacterium]|nr:hypothetical protein [Burkholderiaceae bacterium]
MRIARLIEALRRAREASGKPMLRQLAEIVALRRGRGALGIGEYFEFQLFDDERYTSEQKREFAGWRTKYPLHDALDLPAWKAFSIEKSTFDTFARGAGLPTPKLHAVYSERPRLVRHGRWIRSTGELESFLRRDLQYPAFAKPAVSQWGQGAHVLHRVDTLRDTLTIDRQSTREVADFAREIASKAGGYLFQELLRPEPAIAELTGGGLCTLRIVVLNGGAGGPRMHRALWKLSAKGNVQDNFHHGESGNLLAKVDLASGRVIHLIQGGWPWPQQTDRHPDTGRVMIGFEIPHWRDAVALTLEAATAFPGARLQGWDVALTDRGPVLLEINTPMDADLVQLASGQGLWDADFDAFYREITGFKGPWFETI